jgi:spore germination protein GerM
VTAACRRRWTAAAVALVAIVIVVSCGVPLEDSTNTIANDDVPFELLEPAPTTTTTIAPAGPTTTTPLETVVLYLVRNERVVVVTREYAQPLGMRDRLLQLTLPLTAEEMEQGFRSAVPPGSINDVTPSGGVATVDLTHAFTEYGPSDQVLAFAQITYTLLMTPGIGQVAFTLDTVAIQPLDDEGTVIPGPVTKETYDDLLASANGTATTAESRGR